MSIAKQSRRLLADALNIDPDGIADDAAIGMVDAWDSLAHMRLILEIERYLARSLTTEEIVGITSLKDVEALTRRES